MTIPSEVFMSIKRFAHLQETTFKDSCNLNSVKLKQLRITETKAVQINNFTSVALVRNKIHFHKGYV